MALARAREFPTGADERIGDKHDTAAQVYVIFDNQILPRIIKYMWSGVVPAGARFRHPLYGRARVVIVRSGAPEPGKWFEERVNLYEDYKQFFKAEPGKVQGIALMSSSDSTNSVAGADYDDFVLSLKHQDHGNPSRMNKTYRDPRFLSLLSARKR